MAIVKGSFTGTLKLNSALCTIDGEGTFEIENLNVPDELIIEMAKTAESTPAPLTIPNEVIEKIVSDVKSQVDEQVAHALEEAEQERAKALSEMCEKQIATHTEALARARAEAEAEEQAKSETQAKAVAIPEPQVQEQVNIQSASSSDTKDTFLQFMTEEQIKEIHEVLDNKQKIERIFRLVLLKNKTTSVLLDHCIRIFEKCYLSNVSFLNACRSLNIACPDIASWLKKNVKPDILDTFASSSRIDWMYFTKVFMNTIDTLLQ